MPKVVIDIPEDAYYNFILLGKKINNVEERQIIQAFENGTVLPDNLTNGDIIKAIFPKIRANKKWICGTRDWWNSPYKGGQE